VTIPGSVTSIGSFVFGLSPRLKWVYFKGNAPTVDPSMFGYGTSVSVYYLPETTGWDNAFAGLSPILWNPIVQTSDPTFGLQSNRFGFTITGTTDIPIVLEASTNLASSGWTALQSCNLTNGSIYFNDAAWTNYPGRFYRLRSP
jgi:hypothetical protein